MPDPRITEPARPSVCILSCRFAVEALEPILWGLEEEGIPAQVYETPDQGAVALAKEAAHRSVLNVGIGIDGTEGQTALHHRDLAPERPLFNLPTRDLPSGKLRLLGTNAARLVKGEPLLLESEPCIETGHCGEASDQLVEWIAERVLRALSKA